MICAVIPGPNFADVQQQIVHATAVADVIELRLDNFFSSGDLPTLVALRKTYAIPMIFTLRSRQQGGCYQLSEEQRLKDIALLAQLKPKYLDIESHVDEEFVERIASLHPEIKIIISYHDYTQTPPDFNTVFHNMQRKSATLYKLAFQAESTIDAIRLLCWLKSRKHNNVIAIAMGGHGEITRILGPVIGTPLTYASLSDKQKTAEGQLTVEELTSKYRYRSLNPQTAIYGLIGDPVSTSISDITHNCLIQKCNLNAVYIKMKVKPEELDEFLLLAKQLPLQGLSVTMPLKEKILPYIDQIDPCTLEIGACNTLHFQSHNSILGYNSDGIGALDAIEKIMSVSNKKVVVLGAGGSAKAIAYEVCRRGGQVSIINRDCNKAQALVASLQSAMGISKCHAESRASVQVCAYEVYDILINCTPVDPCIETDWILPHALVMDIRTRSKDTRFLQMAQHRGCQIIYGYQMFAEQAAIQWNLWTENNLDKSACLKLLTEKAIDIL